MKWPRDMLLVLLEELSNNALTPLQEERYERLSISKYFLTCFNRNSLSLLSANGLSKVPENVFVSVVPTIVFPLQF